MLATPALLGLLLLLAAAVAAVAVVVVVAWRRRRATVGASAGAAARRIDADGLRALVDAGARPLIVDLRKRETVQKEPVTIPGSLRLAPHLLVEHARALEPGRPVVLWCT